MKLPNSKVYFEYKPENETLNISEIILNDELQVRNKLDRGLVKTYSRAMANGALFPAVKVIDVEGKLFLIDGFHRIHAAIELNCLQVPALIEKASFKEARVQASLANLRNPKPLNSSEKKNAFKLFIRGGGYKNKYGKPYSYRELTSMLQGLASHATLQRWMWKHFPYVARLMAAANPSGDVNADPEWIESKDNMHYRNAKEAIRKITDSYRCIESENFRYTLCKSVENLHLKLSCYPTEEPEF